MKSSRIHREFYRNGESHRGGADVTFQDILKLFGFRTIEIGRWVTPTEQQIAANLFLMRYMTYAIFCKYQNRLFHYADA